MAFYEPNQNAFVPKQKQPKKIQQLNELGELVEIDDPDYKPLVEYREEQLAEFRALRAQGYTQKAETYIDENGEEQYTGFVLLIPPAPKTDEQLRAEYENRVNALIREKYTLSQELGIMRQKTDKPDEYAEYYSYCEQCKATAKAEIYGG